MDAIESAWMVAVSVGDSSGVAYQLTIQIGSKEPVRHVQVAHLAVLFNVIPPPDVEPVDVGYVGEISTNIIIAGVQPIVLGCFALGTDGPAIFVSGVTKILRTAAIR